VSVAEIAPREDFERTPPHDIPAEQCVLGGMLLSKDAISDVLDVIKATDHYRPAHQIVHETILDLYGRGEPADAITVAAELTKRGEIAQVGGAPYLHTLIASVPTAANAGYYARIVRERAILRRLVEVGTRIVQLGYTGDADADELVDRAQAEVYGVNERRVADDYLPLSEIMPDTLLEIESIGRRGGTMTGVPTGFADLDALMNGLHPGQMIVIAARPAIGKSTLALDLARAASIKHGMSSVIFSLEMSRNEITMKLLSAEARVALQSMRTGQMNEDDWTRLARRMSEVAHAPMFIDDSPNMSMMEIRAKCRRLKQQHDLRLVIVDYLQLMTSPKRVENRQQEVSELSRSLKLLAKELGVPVIAVAQLNRGPEQRTDKRPMLSDLRESGCLTAGTRILRADTGSEARLGDLVKSGECGFPVWSLDERLKLVPRKFARAFPTGVREVFKVTLRSGREVEATANHPFLTYDGWKPLGAISLGTRVATPRYVPSPLASQNLPEAEAVALAHRAERWPFVPSAAFALTKRQLALFLRNLWAIGGCVRWDAESEQARISFTSSSRAMVDDVARLLLRFSVVTRIEQVADGSPRGCYRLRVCDADDQLRFLAYVGVCGPASTQAEACRRRLSPVAGGAYIDTVPPEVWDRVRAVLMERHAPPCETAAAIAVRQRSSSIGRSQPVDSSAQFAEPLGQIASVLDGSDLELLATNDVFWDEVASVQSIGDQEVYDATVEGTHNFVANGIHLHNSIEQDADVVILLHREDAYEKESPRAGEADFIVAKHRNGPTTTVTVAFQGHYSRFVDMARM
jgi:replicative DNA helicase